MKLKLVLLTGVLMYSLAAFAQKPERSYDGKYYYADDFMDGWVVMMVRDKIDTIEGYIKQFRPANEIKSCELVIFKKRLRDGTTKLKPDVVFAYKRYDEVYERFKSPKNKFAFRKLLEQGTINVYMYAGKQMKMNLDESFSFSTDREYIEEHFIQKGDRLMKIEWEDPYIHTELKVFFADCPTLDTSTFVEGMDLEVLRKAVVDYNKFCK